MGRPGFRKALSAPGLLGLVRSRFERVSDPVGNPRSPLPDCLMSALAVFGMKHSSLLRFEEGVRRAGAARGNLRRPYGVRQVPADTTMRERLDGVDPAELRDAFKAVLSALQRGKGLDGFAWLDGHCLLSVDGAGHFSSKSVHCGSCCVKEHKDGTRTHCRQLLGAALASNGPHVRLLQELNMRFVPGAKPGGHADLFETVNASPMTRTMEAKGADGTRRRCRFINGAPLNDANRDLEVNFLEWTGTRPGGKRQRFSWVTDVDVDESNAESLMRAGRARWRIENGTFNTPRNQGHGLERNCGHGHRHLATALAQLMTLAFLIDQAQQRCCGLFRAALAKSGRRVRLWERMRSLFMDCRIDSWEDLCRVLAFGFQKPALTPFDTS